MKLESRDRAALRTTGWTASGEVLKKVRCDVYHHDAFAARHSRPPIPRIGHTREMFAVTTSTALRAPCARQTRARRAPAAARASARVAVDKKSAEKNVITFLAATAVATGVLTLDARVALANDHYANDCDPICHVLDDGAAKSQKQEEEMKKSGPDMGSLMEQLQAQRKAEEAAAKAAKK